MNQYAVKLSNGATEYVNGTSFHQSRIGELIISHPTERRIFMQYEWVEAKKTKKDGYYAHV